MLRTRESCRKIIKEELQSGDIVQHFKRELVKSDDPNSYLYKIICTAIHTETKEPMVVYKALYGDCSVYVRPPNMFLEKVDTSKYPTATQEYRFEKYTGLIRKKNRWVIKQQRSSVHALLLTNN